MLIKSPRQITSFLDQFSHKLDTPEAYYGTEPNTFQWTEDQWKEARLRWAVMAPFDYLQAIGNATIPLLYRWSNDYNHVDRICERAYYPTSHAEVKMFERHGIPMWGLETRHSFGEYDVLGFPLNYTPYWINVIKALRISGIPARASERADCKEPYPLIMVGGHIFADPWFVAPTADIIFCGEAEDETLDNAQSQPTIYDEKTGWFNQHEATDNPGLNAVLDDIANYKERGMLYDAAGREQMLHELAVKYKFLFIPRFYTLNHQKGEDGYWRVTGWDRKYSDLPDRPVKRFVRNLDAVQPLTQTVLPFHDPTMGMAQIQIARGCTYHCGYCAAAYREAPYRERSEQLMLDSFADIMKATGSTKVSPLTLEFGTYSHKKRLSQRILQELSDEMSMPSLRIDVFGRDPVFAQLAVKAQKRNATIACEGNSQKMREIVSKGIQEEDILKSFVNAIAAGYDSVKLYMIANLPGETDEDMEEIYQTCLKMDQIRKSTGSKIKVRLSWKPLCVQTWLPFQWLQARHWTANLAPTMKRIQELGFGTQLGDEARSGLGNFIQVAELADDVAGEALLDTILEADVSTYGALPKRVFEILERQLAARNRTFADYYRQKDIDEVFAWDIIDTLIDKKYILRMYKRIQRRIADDETLPMYGGGFLEKFGSCSIGCTACGACDDTQLEVMKEFAGRTDDAVQLRDIHPVDKTTVRDKWLLHLDILSSHRFVTPVHYEYAVRRAFFRENLPITFRGIDWATKRIKTLKPWFAGRQYMEVQLTQKLDVRSWIDRLNIHLASSGVSITFAEQVPISFNISKQQIEAMLWELEIDQPYLALQQAVKESLSREYTKLTYRVEKYRVGEVTEEINLREVLRDAFAVLQGSKVKLVCLIRSDISPYDVGSSIIGHRTDILRYAAELKGALTDIDPRQQSAMTKFCDGCGEAIPTEFGHPFQCIRCSYGVSRKLLAV